MIINSGELGKMCLSESEKIPRGNRHHKYKLGKNARGGREIAEKGDRCLILSLFSL